MERMKLEGWLDVEQQAVVLEMSAAAGMLSARVEMPQPEGVRELGKALLRVADDLERLQLGLTYLEGEGDV